MSIGCSNSSAKKGESTQSKHEKKTKPFANPLIIYGSSFGHFFQSFYRLGNYEAMLKFTATQTRIKYGSAQLLNHYKNELKFDFALGGLTNAYHDGDTICIMYSNAKIMATRVLIRLRVIVENDSCKILIPSLSPNPFN